MSDSDTIHRLMYYALIEIRHYATEGKQEEIRKLADLFHNVPLSLARVSRGELKYKEVAESLLSQAKFKGCDAWLEARLDDIKRFDG